MGRKITKSELIDEEKVTKLLNENSLLPFGEWKPIEKGNRITINGRKMKKGYFWEVSQRIDPKTKEVNPLITNPVSVIIKDENENYLFIAQPRASMKDEKNLVISFPAGLREGKSILETAVQEAKEETGTKVNKCKIISDENKAMPKSAGLTDESDYVVECTANSKKIEKSKNEKSEDINYFWMKPNEFLDTIKKSDKRVYVENNVWMFMKGYVKGMKHLNN